MEFEDLYLSDVSQRCARNECKELGTHAPILEFRAARDGRVATAVMKMLVCPKHQEEFPLYTDWLTDGGFERILHSFKAEGKLIPVRQFTSVRWYPYHAV